jgi:hypothetical protein
MSELPSSEDDDDSQFRELDKPDLWNESEDDRIEAILAPVRESHQRGEDDTREHMHLVLDALMDLQDLGIGQGYALDLANDLVRETMKWLSEGALSERLLNRWQAVAKNPSTPYPPGAIQEVLSDWPMVMPRDMQFQMMMAFMDLQRSTKTISPLFRPEHSPTNLALKQDAEERMLRWISYQIGQGRTEDWAVRQVADAVGLSGSSIRNEWPRKWRERAGKELVEAARELAKQLGRKSALGQWRYDWMRSRTAEELPAPPEADPDSREPHCHLIYLFSDEKGLRPSDKDMFSRYQDEAHVLSEYPDVPLKTLARVWKRTRALPPQEISGPITKGNSHRHLGVS